MTEETTTPETKVEEPNLPALTYGFAILVDENGNVFLEKNPEVFALPVEREATMLEVRRYMSEILMDLQAQAAAEYTALRLLPKKEETA